MATTQLLDDEGDLVRRARDGDEAAFTALYGAYLTPVHDFSNSMLRSRADAEDVTSTTFMTAIQRLGSLRDPEAFKGWLFQIARNAALDLIRTRGRVTPVDEYFDSATAVDAAAPPDPSQVTEDAELRALVWEAAETLNPRDRSVYDLVVRQGLTSAEVAQALDVRPAYAYILVNRLKGAVEQALEALLLAKVGRRDCAELDAIVAGFAGEMTPRTRKAINRHAKGCDACSSSRTRKASVPALLAGVAVAAPSEAFAAELTSRLHTQWASHTPSGFTGSAGLGAKVGIASMVAVLSAAAVVWLAPITHDGDGIGAANTSEDVLITTPISTPDQEPPAAQPEPDQPDDPGAVTVITPTPAPTEPDPDDERPPAPETADPTRPPVRRAPTPTPTIPPPR